MCVVHVIQMHMTCNRIWLNKKGDCSVMLTITTNSLIHYTSI
jgi:hypothetical protein